MVGNSRKSLQLEDPKELQQGYEQKTIFIANLPYSITSDDLFEIFSKIGPVIDTIIPFNKDTQQPRGYAFVEFENNNSAVIAVEKTNGITLIKRRIAVSLAYKKGNCVQDKDQ